MTNIPKGFRLLPDAPNDEWVDGFIREIGWKVGPDRTGQAMAEAARQFIEMALAAAPASSCVGVPGFILKRVRRELEEAKNQKGMRTNDGKVRLEICDVERLLHATPAHGWMPIESAPKDGTKFLAVVDGDVRFVKWCKTSHVPIYGWILCDMGVEDRDICEPELWQPLPKATRESEVG